MFELTQIVYYLVCILGTLLFGLPFASLLRRGNHREGTWPVALLMGSALIMILSYWMSVFNLHMKYIWIIIGILCTILWVFAAKRGYITRQLLIPPRYDRLLLLICFAAGFLALIPMVGFRACFPYSDGYTYISIADYLLEHGYGTTAVIDEYTPWLTQIYLYQIRGLRMGAQFLLSFWTAAFQEEYSIFVYAPVSALGVFLYGVAVWIFTRLVWNLSEKRVVYVVVFSAFNISLIVWSAIFGFFPQLFGLAFLIVALGQTIKLLTTHQTFFASDFIEGALWISAMAFCYNEIVPFFILFVASFYILESKRSGLWKKNFKFLSLLAVISLAILGKYSLNMVKGIISQLGAVVGGAQSLDWFSYVACWLSSAPVQFSFPTGGYPTVLRFLFAGTTIVLLTLLIFGVLKNRTPDKIEHLKTGAILSIPLFICLIYFGSLAPNPFGTGYGNSWSVYKLAQYSFPIICCFLFPYFSDVFESNKKFSKALSILFPTFFCIAGLMHTCFYSGNVTALMRQYTNQAENPVLAYLDVAKEYQDETKVLNLVNFPMEHRKLLTYFLRDNRLSSNWSSDGYFSIYPYGDPVFDPEGIFLKYDPEQADSELGFTEIPSEDCVFLQPDTGVGTAETSDELGAWTWNDMESQYQIENYTTQNTITITTALSSADAQPSDVDIYVNDQCIDTVTVDAQGRTPVSLNVDLPSGTACTLKFVYHGAAVQEAGGGRLLNLCIWNLDVTTGEQIG